MIRGAPHGNEIRASERNSSKLMPQPAQIDHVQAKFRILQDFENFGVMKMLACVFITRLFRNGLGALQSYLACLVLANELFSKGVPEVKHDILHFALTWPVTT